MTDKKNSMLVATILGLLTALFWSIQHPFQNPLYTSFSVQRFGFLEAILISEIFSIMLMVIGFFFVPYVRQAAIMVFSKQNWLLHILISGLLSTLSLLIYAIGQSRLDGLTISVLIAASPVTAIVLSAALHTQGYSLFSALLNMGKLLNKLRANKQLITHIVLSLVVIVITIFGSNGTANPVFSSLFDVLAAVGIFFVPALYYAAATYIRSVFDEGIKQQLGAACISTIILGILIAIFAFLVLEVSNHQYRYESVQTNVLSLFLFGVFSITVLAEVTLQFALRRSEDDYNHSTLFFHLTPFFSFIVAFLGFILVSEVYFQPQYHHAISGMLLVGVISYCNFFAGKTGGDLDKKD